MKYLNVIVATLLYTLCNQANAQYTYVDEQSAASLEERQNSGQSLTPPHTQYWEVAAPVVSSVTLVGFIPPAQVTAPPGGSTALLRKQQLMSKINPKIQSAMSLMISQKSIVEELYYGSSSYGSINKVSIANNALTAAANAEAQVTSIKNDIANAKKTDPNIFTSAENTSVNQKFGLISELASGLRAMAEKILVSFSQSDLTVYDTHYTSPKSISAHTIYLQTSGNCQFFCDEP